MKGCRIRSKRQKLCAVYESFKIHIVFAAGDAGKGVFVAGIPVDTAGAQDASQEKALIQTSNR